MPKKTVTSKLGGYLNQKMMEYLPKDLWIQIFIRLPPKTILRCLSVCKSWKLSIQHPSFIEAHLLQQRQDLMLVRYVPEKNIKSDNNLARKKKAEVYSLHIDDDSFTMHGNHEFPIPHPSREYYRVVGSCNGIICITCDHTALWHETYLWNPTIHKCIELPRPMFTYNKIGSFDHELGFGFDCKSNDYKVIRIVDPLDRDDCPLEVEIFSLRSGAWRKASHLALDLGVRIFERVFNERDCQVYLNGAVHWVGCDREHNRYMVIVFLLDEEVFRCFELPTDMIRDDVLWMRKLRAVVFQGALSLIQFSEQRCGVWVMKDYGVSNSWSKQLDINLSKQVQRVIGIRNKGELLIEISGALYSYDPEPRKGKQFNFLDERDLLDWKRLQGDHVEEHFPIYVASDDELDQAESHMEELVYVASDDDSDYDFDGSDDSEAPEDMVPEYIRNYDPEAAPTELGIRSRTNYSFRFAFHCERYTESLALIGSINSVKSQEEEFEEGNSSAGLAAELQYLGEEYGESEEDGVQSQSD